MFWPVVSGMLVALVSMVGYWTAYKYGKVVEREYLCSKFVLLEANLLQENADLRCKISELSYADAAGAAAVEEAFRASDS